MSTLATSSSVHERSSVGSTTIVQTLFARNRNYMLLCLESEVRVISTTSFETVARIPVDGNALITSADLVLNGSLLVVVFENCKFQLWDVRKGVSISPIVSVEEYILNVKICSKRIALVTPEKVLIFGVRNLTLVYVINRGPDVPLASQSLLSMDEHGLCVFAESPTGCVRYFDSVTLQRSHGFRAHSSSISAIEMIGDLLITASSKGTIVRVFRISTSELVAIFRRGRADSPISSLQVTALDEKNIFLTVTGDSDTVHIFRIDSSLLDHPNGDTESIADGAATRSGSVLQSVLSIFPKQYKDAVEAARDFAHIRLRRESNYRYIAAVIAQSNKVLLDRSTADVVVISEESGYAFVYEINTGRGGECRLKGEHTLLSDEPSSAALSTEPKPDIVSVEGKEGSVVQIEDMVPMTSSVVSGSSDPVVSESSPKSVSEETPASSYRRNKRTSGRNRTPKVHTESSE